MWAQTTHFESFNKTVILPLHCWTHTREREKMCLSFYFYILFLQIFLFFNCDFFLLLLRFHSVEIQRVKCRERESNIIFWLFILRYSLNWRRHGCLLYNIFPWAGAKKTLFKSLYLYTYFFTIVPFFLKWKEEIWRRWWWHDRVIFCRASFFLFLESKE